MKHIVLAILFFSFSIAHAEDDYSSPRSLYHALVAQPHEALTIGGGEIDVVFADGTPGLDRAPVLAWIRKSAEAATTYFGRFPVAKVGLLVIATDGGRINGGTTYGFNGSAIRIHVGRSADERAFTRDWVLVHEMTHLALPVVPQRSAWLMEGSATYIEPIARAQAGQLSIESVWSDSLDGMPKGQPASGDQGLDRTPTWGRTYWGGATFCLLADIKIREQTHNRYGLIDAFRAVNRESGGNGADWSVDQVMAVGDKATGTHVLVDLYAEMKDAPVATDLDMLFAKLGIARQDGQIRFDEAAPLAGLRRSITEIRR
jgi:hypothetical protein